MFGVIALGTIEAAGILDSRRQRFRVSQHWRNKLTCTRRLQDIGKEDEDLQ